MNRVTRIIFTLIFILITFGLMAAPSNTHSSKQSSAVQCLINELEDTINGMIKKGEFSKNEILIESLLKENLFLPPSQKERLQRYLSTIQAIKREYTLTEKAVYKDLATQISDLSPNDMTIWETDGSLEYYLIDGEKKYYYDCIGDLFSVNPKAALRAHIEKKRTYDAITYPLETISAGERGEPIIKTIHVAFSFTEKLGELPDHARIRCWIPYARENVFQSQIKLVSSSAPKIALPTKKQLTSMIYFEHKIDKKNQNNAQWRQYFSAPNPAWIFKMKDSSQLADTDFIYQIIFSYQSMGIYQSVDPATIQPYVVGDAQVQKYARETEPQRFTPYLQKLLSEIVSQETNPYLKARRIYQWVCQNIVWTSTKPVWGDRAEATARTRRGDCGDKANLFISLCRMSGIPTRIQGGWRIEPNRQHSDHSWTQVYFAPLGWLPVDVDAGSHLINHSDGRLKFFYFGNRTPYRLIVYDDEEPLTPKKQYDCIGGGGPQLGAFEWSGGDLEPRIKIDTQVE